MGLLERWDRHNQTVMDRARTQDPPAWTIPTVLILAIVALRIADRVTDSPWVALVVSAVVIATFVFVIVRIVRGRRGTPEDEPVATTASGAAVDGGAPDASGQALGR